MDKVKALVAKQTKTTSIPALNVAGVWELDAKKKAAAFAECFLEKAVLPELVHNKFTPPSEERGAAQETTVYSANFVYPSASEVEALLRKLSADSSSGPDEVPTRILKECPSALAAPIAELLQIIIDWHVATGVG